ncbi:MAG: BamA/TamA family outer membrane protein [Chitinophagales bacterium]
MKKWICCFLLLLGAMPMRAQQLQLTVQAADQPPDFFKKQYAYKTAFRDTAGAQKEVVRLWRRLRETGYAGASYDSMSIIGNQATAYIYVGAKSDLFLIKNGNIPPAYLDAIGMKHAPNTRLIAPTAVDVLKAKLLQSAENTGYPFAETWLDSFRTGGPQMEAQLFIDRHQLIRFDTLETIGKTKVKRIFLRNYLGIKPNRAYNEATVKRITQRLNELQFAEVLRPYSITFDRDRARVNVFIKDKKASQFDLLIGVLPGSSGQKVLITGDVKIHLVSPLGLGEELFLQWQKLQPQTQTLDVRVIYPYVVGLPLGVNVQFQLYKKDTTYLDLNGDYGVQYQLLGSNYLKASFRQKITILQTVDTNFVKSNRALPLAQDLTTSQFALELFLQKLNYRFNPVSGYVLKADVALGVRSIKKNNAIVSLHDELTGGTFAGLYDTVALRSFQLNIGAAIDKYWKLARRMTLKTGFEGRYFYAARVLDNEKYRIGGINSLRGFDDRSIFTPYYLMGNIEYRYLLSKNSYAYAFFNAAMVQDTRHFKNKPFDFPFGFGAGAAFETKIGIFGLSYAMGRQLDNPINFKSGKIHFGYVNYF